MGNTRSRLLATGLRPTRKNARVSLRCLESERSAFQASNCTRQEALSLGEDSVPAARPFAALRKYRRKDQFAREHSSRNRKRPRSRRRFLIPLFCFQTSEPSTALFIDSRATALQETPAAFASAKGAATSAMLSLRFAGCVRASRQTIAPLLRACARFRHPDRSAS